MKTTLLYAHGIRRLKIVTRPSTEELSHDHRAIRLPRASDRSGPMPHVLRARYAPWEGDLPALPRGAQDPPRGLGAGARREAVSGNAGAFGQCYASWNCTGFHSGRFGYDASSNAVGKARAERIGSLPRWYVLLMSDRTFNRVGNAAQWVTIALGLLVAGIQIARWIRRWW